MMLWELVEKYPKIFSAIGVFIGCWLVYALIAMVIAKEKLK